MAKPNEIKITITGDSVVGKTSLLSAYANNKFPEKYVATVFDTLNKDICVEGINYRLSLWDTAGQEDYERLRPLSYPGTSCFIVCYAVDSKNSYENVVHKWFPELNHFNAVTPKIIVATKIDLRKKAAFSYGTSEGEQLMKKVGAQGYVECSALEMIGVDKVFLKALEVYRDHKFTPRKKRKCTIL